MMNVRLNHVALKIVYLNFEGNFLCVCHLQSHTCLVKRNLWFWDSYFCIHYDVWIFVGIFFGTRFLPCDLLSDEPLYQNPSLSIK